MGPMIFFSFETMSCFIDNSIEDDQCQDTSSASGYLSFYLCVFFFLSLTAKMVSKDIQRAMAWNFHDIATMNLELWQKAEGLLFLITALSSMYLLSVIGVEKDPDALTKTVGSFGLLTVMSGTCIHVVKVNRANQQSELVGHSEETGRATAISLSSMQDQLVMNSVM